VTMLTEEARNFNWLLETFVQETAGVTDAMAVSSDGVLIARSETLEGEESDLLCAIIAGTAGLALAVSRSLAAGERRRRRELPGRGGDPRVRRGLDRLPDHGSGPPRRPAADPGAAGGAHAALVAGLIGTKTAPQALVTAIR
jgi:hypothetical protein